MVFPSSYEPQLRGSSSKEVLPLAIPSKKSEAIEHVLRDLNGGVDRRTMIDADLCAICAQPATEFTDELSRKEYTISGLCQACQDGVFGSPE